LAGPKQNLPKTNDPGAIEAWIRRAAGEQGIRLRQLHNVLGRGGSITQARILEDGQGLWTIHIKLSDQSGEFVLHKFEADTPKIYKDVALAVSTLFKDLRYRGAITLSSDRDYNGPSA
jgi:hypothetical protein